MKIISIINPKGGVGKTPISIHIAYYLSQQGHNVAVLDSDKQRGISLFADTRKANYPDLKYPAMFELEGGEGLIAKLEGIEDQGFEVVLVDTPAGFERNHVDLIEVSDAIIIPMSPGEQAFAASYPAIEGMLEMVAQGRTDAVVGIIPTMFSRNQKLSRGLIKLVEQSGFPLFDRYLPSSIYYSTAIDQGLTLFELAKYSNKSERAKIETPLFPLRKFLEDVDGIVKEEQ